MNRDYQGSDIQNYLFSLIRRREAEQLEYDRVHRELAEMMCEPRRQKMTPVDYFKQQLGRQDRTWNGEFRYWIWERRDWRAYVSNLRGISIELPVGLSNFEWLKCWADVRASLGLGDLPRYGTRVRTPSGRLGHTAGVVANNKMVVHFAKTKDEERVPYYLLEFIER